MASKCASERAYGVEGEDTGKRDDRHAVDGVKFYHLPRRHHVLPRLRPPAPAQRILDRRRHVAHRRGDRRRGGRRDARARDHRSRQHVRSRQVLQGGAERGGEAGPRVRRLADARGRARPAVPRAAPGPVARWLSQAHRLADSRISRQCVSRPRRDEAGVVRRRHRRPDRAVRRPRRRHRPCAPPGQPRRRDQSRARVGGALSGSLLSRGAACRSRRRRRACRGDGRAREGADAPRCRDASRPVPATGRVPGARGARVHRGGPCARRSAPPQALHAGSVFQDAGGNDRGLFRSSASARQFGEDRRTLQPGASARQELPARVPYARRRHAGRPPAFRGCGRA